MTRAEIKRLIMTAVEAVYGLKDVEFDVDYAPAGLGDFAANIGFKLAKPLGKSPKEIVENICRHMNDMRISGVELAGSGYLNVTLTAEYHSGQLADIGPGFGKTTEGKGKKVQVEFISANPTGPTTFGNARGGFIGDTISRVLGRAGYEVVREYYFNDGGTQIRKLVESVKVAAGLIEIEEVQYRGAYIDELALEFGEQLKTASDDEAAKALTSTILGRYIHPAVASMNISFDVWFNERSLAEDGKVEQVIAELKKKDLIYEQDGATWLASSRLGDERDRVLVKSTGDLTYLANDIAYHADIFTARGFDWAIKDWGADHAGQVPSLKLVIGALVPKAKLDVVLHQFVRLIQGGKEVKMSKRAGNFVTVEEVIEQVGSDVARFFFLMRSNDSQLDFDLDLAREQSQKNPLWYLMYAYVRAGSILKQAEEKGLVIGEQLTDPTEVELSLIRVMLRLPELLADIRADFGVHRLTFYGLEVAKLFHDYYEAERIIALPADRAAEKLYLITAYRAFMEVYFDLLGLTPLQEMSRDQD